MAKKYINSMVIIVLCLPFHVSCVKRLYMTKFSQFYGWIHLHDDSASPSPIVDQTPQSCSKLCFHDDTCSLVEYNSRSKSCSLFYWKDVEMLRVPNININTARDTVVLVKPGNKQLYLRSSSGTYSYAVSEAPGLCKRVGGRVATLEEILNARDNEGWDVCGCGWLTNGQPTSVVSTLTNACKHNQAVCGHMDPPTYDVHCTELYIRSSSGTYSYAITEAPGLCQRVGGRVATLDEILSARDNEGWDVCGCGWLTNGEPTSIVSTTTNACKSNQAVCRHMDPPTYDVHCTVV